jgi:hypothetical protein
LFNEQSSDIYIRGKKFLIKREIFLFRDLKEPHAEYAGIAENTCCILVSASSATSAYNSLLPKTISPAVETAGLK